MTTVAAQKRSRLGWVLFVAGAVLSWGAYGVLLYLGGQQLGNPLKALLCVGVAYFLIGVIVPVAVLGPGTSASVFSSQGVLTASVAGALGAIGAACIIYAFRAGGLPLYVMPLVFGGAPLVNVLYTMAVHPPKVAPHPLLYVGFLVTAIGADRPGLVSLLSDRARGFGANWAASRMASLAGQFAGMVHFEVPAENARALAEALAGLESAGLRVVIAESETQAPTRNRRVVRLDLVGQDRPGIMRDLSARLAERGVSIDELDTEIASAAMSAESLFKVKAALIVPDALSNEELRRSLEMLANEMMVDIALGDTEAAGG